MFIYIYIRFTPAPSVLEISDGEDLWQWSQLEIRLNAFRWSTIPQKQFIIIIIIIIISSILWSVLEHFFTPKNLTHDNKIFFLFFYFFNFFSILTPNTHA